MPELPDLTKAGPYGSAVAVDLPEEDPRAAETVCHWLITAPVYHPAWSQYMLVVVRLRDGVPGFPPPKRQFPGATHELIVMALDPEDGPYDAGISRKYIDGGLPFLTPLNIAYQMEGTDGEAVQLARWAAWGVTHGHLNPETADAPEYIRAGWKTSLTKTLAHIRGEEHAR